MGTFLAPGSISAADLEITEIMYNPEGSDTDYEWLEIRNTSASSVDLSKWSFYENETDHNLTDTGDGLLLPTDEWAVVARNPDAFPSRYSVELLVGSSFSLVNGGEEIALTTPSGSIVSAVVYDPSDGADGDGNSLQLISGSWQTASPTPGAKNVEGGEEKIQSNETDSSPSGRSGPGASMESRGEYSNQQSGEVAISAGGNVDGWVGIDVELVGEIEGVVDTDEFTASWLLGNGDERGGTTTSYTYQHPGEYVATFIVNADEETFSDQIVVDVIKPELRLEARSGQDGFIKIHNKTGRRFNLSEWQLISSGKEFALPEHSTALAHGEVIVPHRVSGFFSSSAALYRPDGTLATSTEASQASNHYSGFGTTNPGNSMVIQAAPASSEARQRRHAETEESGSQKDATSSTASSAGLVFGTSTSSVGTTDQLNVFAQWGAMLLALLLAAIGTVVLMRRVSKPADDSSVQASKFDINEIKE